MRRSRIREMDEQARAFNRMIEALRWFERYVPKSLVRRFIAQGAHDIPSVYRIATVCFTDIVGYTRMTEPMNPSDYRRPAQSPFRGPGRRCRGDRRCGRQIYGRCHDGLLARRRHRG
jgi:hypothetical protein